MRISIGHRLFICVLLAILGVVGCAVLLLRQNVVDSFADYAAGIELDRLDGLARSLARQYRQQGGWDFLPPTAAARESWVMEELQRLQQQHIAPPAPPAPPVPPVAPVAPVQTPAPPLPPLAPLPPMPPPLPPAPPGGAPDVLSLQERVSLLDSAGNYLAGRRAGPGDAGARLPVTVNGRAAGTLFIARPRNPNDALAVLFLQQLKERLLLIVLASVVLSALAAVLLAAHFRKPIRRLADGARALAEGRYDTRLPFARSDELGELAQRFNQLAHKLDQAETSRRQWVADTSHELRTPLSVLRAQLEAIQDGVRPANPDSVAAMLRQVLSLNKLIDELYVLARADVGTLAFQPESIDLWQLACQQAAAFEEKFRAAGLVLECGAAPGRATVHGDPERLAQVLSNLFENCTRYSAAGGRIGMHGAIEGAALVLTIDDSAPGVPEAALPHLAERFYRVDASRSREHGGAGLGLALCQRIVSAHGGSMAFAHSPLGGLRVRLTLPLEAA